MKGQTDPRPHARAGPLKKPAALISDPFVSLTGNYLISLSHPIFSADKRYLSYVAGTIYLESRQRVALSLLGQHYYQDGSYLYVVDRRAPSSTTRTRSASARRLARTGWWMPARGRMARKACSTPQAARCWQALPRWRTQAGG